MKKLSLSLEKLRNSVKAATSAKSGAIRMPAGVLVLLDELQAVLDFTVSRNGFFDIFIGHTST